ncbi:MAG: acetate--CoA ligase family protein, partial [Alphaproteobacteria bacterium]
MDSVRWKNLKRLIKPQSVAIIGASSDPTKTSGRPLRYLRQDGFRGKIWPVNPSRAQIDGIPCFNSIRDLPGTPDVGIIMLGPRTTQAAVAELSETGCAAAIIVGSGYAEIGSEGKEIQEDLLRYSGDMRLLGPNTIGMLNLVDGITLSASGALDIKDRLKGNIAILSQSGGILGSLLSRAAEKGIGLSHLVATGNEADIEISDLMSAFAKDPNIRVISLYIESIRDKQKFEQAADDVRRAGKPIVAYKVGRSEAGIKSTASHTGALAGKDEIYDGFFAQTGIIRAERYDDLLDVPQVLVANKFLKGKRLGILTTTGGAGSLIADICGIAGFTAPDPDKITQSKLNNLLEHSGFSSEHNPIDLTLAGLEPQIIRGAIQALLESSRYDAVISIIGSSGLGRPDLVAEPVIELSKKTDKPII